MTKSHVFWSEIEQSQLIDAAVALIAKEKILILDALRIVQEQVLPPHRRRKLQSINVINNELVNSIKRKLGMEAPLPVKRLKTKAIGQREWVGYTNEERERIVPVLAQGLLNHDEKTMTILLKAILIDVEQQLREKNT